MIVVWACLSVLALSQRNPQPERPPNRVVPKGRVSPATPTEPKTGTILWRDSSLSLALRRLPGTGSPRRARLRLTLSNHSADPCWIPGTFCQEGKESDWWSHAVRVNVALESRFNRAIPAQLSSQLKAPGPWRVGPRYGERDLHQHESFLSYIRPQQQMDWEFCVGDLIEGTDGGPTSESWERAEGPFQITCELSQPGHRLVSNRLQVSTWP